MRSGRTGRRAFRLCVVRSDHVHLGRRFLDRLGFGRELVTQLGLPERDDGERIDRVRDSRSQDGLRDGRVP